MRMRRVEARTRLLHLTALARGKKVLAHTMTEEPATSDIGTTTRKLRTSAIHEAISGRTMMLTTRGIAAPKVTAPRTLGPASVPRLQWQHSKATSSSSRSSGGSGSSSSRSRSARQAAVVLSDTAQTKWECGLARADKSNAPRGPPRTDLGAM